MKKYCVGVFLAALLIGISGCATNRGVMDYKVNQDANPEASNPDSAIPANAKLVMIVQVTDSRAFERRPDRASTPSLRDGKIDDKSITSRAFARKRNGFGAALGDILLPENRTVNDVIKEATIKALRVKNYTVVEENSPYASKATPITLDIDKFWCWFSPGAMKIAIECQITVKIRAAGILEAGSEDTVNGYTRYRAMAANTKAWNAALNGGVESYIADLEMKLK